MKSFIRATITVALLAVTLVTLAGCGCRYTKITKANNIPDKVLQVLSESELQRGIYYFSSGFTNKHAYLVVCGGDKYPKGYDAEIVAFEYTPLTFGPATAIGTKTPPIYGVLNAEIEEKSVDTSTEYSSSSKYPYVVFKISGHEGEEEWLIVTNKDLPVNYWWGRDATRMDTKFGTTFEVVESAEQAPDYITKSLSRTGFIDEVNRLSPDGEDGITDIVIVGEDNRPFYLAVESVSWKPAGERHYCDVVLRKHYSEEAVLYQDKETPVAIVRIQSDQLKEISVSSVTLIDDNLNLVARMSGTYIRLPQE